MIKQVLLTIVTMMILTMPNDANAISVHEYKDICMLSAELGGDKGINQMCQLMIREMATAYTLGVRSSGGELPLCGAEKSGTVTFSELVDDFDVYMGDLVESVLTNSKQKEISLVFVLEDFLKVKYPASNCSKS